MSVVETVLMLCYLGNKDNKKKSLHMFGTEAFLCLDKNCHLQLIDPWI